MGRLRCAVVVGSLIVGATFAGACGARQDGAPPDPTIAHVDFTPKLVVELSDDRLTAAPGPRVDPAVRTDPPVVPSGTVVEVRNAGGRPHRLQGGTTFDTGVLRPGESTVVVLTNTTDADVRLALTDVVDDEGRGVLTVTPAPAPPN